MTEQPIGWVYELAGARHRETGIYTNWERRISFEKPCAGEGMRDVQPLYACPPPMAMITEDQQAMNAAAMTIVLYGATIHNLQELEKRWNRLHDTAWDIELNKVHELKLCEQQHTTLKPDQLYRFAADDDCEYCRNLKYVDTPA